MARRRKERSSSFGCQAMRQSVSSVIARRSTRMLEAPLKRSQVDRHHSLKRVKAAGGFVVLKSPARIKLALSGKPAAGARSLINRNAFNGGVCPARRLKLPK